MPRGGVRPGSGRPKGSPNKPKPDAERLKAIALEYSEEAIEQLHHLAHKSKTDSVRLGACIALLDRAVGRPPQAIAHSGGLTLTHEQALEQIRDKLRAAGIEPPGENYTPETPAMSNGASA